MGFELWLLKQTSITNITPLIGNINWRGNIDELGDEISFDIAFNDTRHFPKNPCELGDIVILKNDNNEITRGIIVEESKSGRDPIGYVAFDFAFYLNKSNAVYQFKKLSADQCIKKILKDFNIPFGSIASMTTKIDKIFNDKLVSDIIREIIKLEEQKKGVKFLMEMRQGKLYIERQKDLIIKGAFKLFEIGPNIDVTSAISNPMKKRSIGEMINSIQVVSNDKVVFKKENTAMLNKYGRLQKVVTLDENEKLTAKQVAQNELNELSKVVEEVSLDLMGDYRFRAGRLFEVSEPLTGIKGTYLIKDVNHTISNGIHQMSLGLEAR
ncbi:hypothetical protein MKZ20_20140 [Psychrobacillus sp. FSL K6-2684]|uniref:XkdQ/YqbQ family protein n=1 Tax=Psychrobacillus sp. FSL K6-2684 TaxID=2921547 RepID=UPI0030F6CE5A